MLYRARRRFASPLSSAVRFAAIVLLCLGLLPAAAPVAAEGSRDMTDDAVVTQGYRAFLEWHATATTAGIPRQTTIKAYAEPGETIYIGSSAMGRLQGDVIIRSPQDATPASLWPAAPGAKRCTARGGGVIAGRAQEEAGPLPAAGGFAPCVVTPAETTAAGAGVWEFDFISPNPNASLNNDPSPPLPRDAEWNTRAADFQNFAIAAWDVSVRDTDAGDPSGAVDQEIPGRVFANYLALNLGGNAGGSNPADVGLYAQFYIQTNDGYGYQVAMNGIDPFGFIFFSNAEGIIDQAGLPIYRSVQLAGTNVTQALPPGFRVHSPRSSDNIDARDITHKIFFDLGGPAADMPASAPSPSGATWLLVPPVVPPEPQNMSFTGEEGTPGQAGTNPLGGYFTFDAPRGATYSVIIDLNGDGLYGTGNDRTLNGPTDDGANRVYWDGLDGNGVKVPAGPLSFSAQIQLFVGEVHFPFIDAENHPNGHRLTRVRDADRPGEPDPSLVFYDDTYNFTGANTYDWSICAATDTPAPPAAFNIANPRCYGTALDARSALQGAPTSNPPGAHRWTGTGANGFGDRRLIDTWAYYPSTPIPLIGQFVLAEAELSIEKSHAPPQLTPGGPISYSVVVRNGGPTAAVGAKVRDDVPAAVLGVSWTCAVTTGVGRCGDTAGTGNLIDTTVDLDPGAVITYAITGTVSPEAEGTLTNTATVRRPNDNTDPNLSNNIDTNVAPIIQVADLELTKSLVTTPPLTVGGVVEFSIALRNRGPGRADNVTVVDQLPAGLAFVSAAPSKGSYDPASGLWTVGSMLRNEVATLNISATWDGSQVTNTAQVASSDQPDPDSTPNNNDPSEDDQSSVSLPPAVADLELTKRVSAARVNVGQSATFTLELTNRGPDGATNVRVSDRLPVGLAFVAATPSQGSYDPVSGEWSVGALASGAQATLTIEVTVLGPGPFTNIAQVSASDQYDPDSTPNNDDASEDDQGFATLAGDLADLSISKRVDNPTPNINDVITYTVELRNDGPSDATGVEVTDQIPVGLEYVSHTASQGAYTVATGLWSVGSVPAGGSATLSISARVRSFARLVNVAEVTSSDQPDVDSTPGNGDPTEDDYASVPLSPQISDLALTKVANAAQPSIGGNVTFTVELTNKGPSVATGVQVTDKLPAGLTYLSHTTIPGATTYDPFSGIWNVGTIGVSEIFTLTVTARMDGPGPFTNVAEVSDSDQFDPNSTPGNNNPSEDDQGTATVRSPIADLSVSKRSAEPNPNAAGEVTYTVGVHNAGPDAATGVRVGEQLPAGSTLLASTPSKGTFVAGDWDVGSLAVGETALLTLTIRVGGPPPYVNIAEVTASDLPDPDSVPGNGNPGEDDIARVELPSGVIDLELTLDVAPLPKLSRGAFLTVNLLNRGPATATGVEVENVLPDGLRFVRAAPAQGSYDGATGRWIVGDLPVNGTTSLQIVVEIVAGANVEIIDFAQVTRANEYDIDSTPNNRPAPPPVEDEEDVVSFSLLTPVTLKRFTATATAAGVELQWETGAEFETAGFYLYRAEGGGRAAATRITPSMVAARGDGSAGASYSFVDAGATPGRGYSYWLVEVSRGGATSEYGPVSVVNRPFRIGLPLIR
jgi:uncharacterized repeat protein (TIGR01451 family)